MCNACRVFLFGVFDFMCARYFRLVWVWYPRLFDGGIWIFSVPFIVGITVFVDYGFNRQTLGKKKSNRLDGWINGIILIPRDSHGSFLYEI